MNENITRIIIGFTVPLIIFLIKIIFRHAIFTLNHWFIKQVGSIKWFEGDLSGNWQLIWKLSQKESKTKKFESNNTFSGTVFHFGKFVAFECKFNNIYYYFNGKIDNPNKLTGSWYSIYKYGYHGVYQAHVNYELNSIIGKWIGFNSNNEILANDLKLKKL
ncbi:hypothetical protein EHQ46_06085 [Leptospira yanagawae]|uniref:Uncharacterized protein n=1 Tax=Leptospira yanagawae TaxID=293069 RepID=A0ABY2M538_9LEPT|nr:hypothetical protein [Leptospira yanagawae]TGL23019.1 hypothetical protein EHQ46_06085 [Leptospira yanagawae]